MGQVRLTVRKLVALEAVTDTYHRTWLAEQQRFWHFRWQCSTKRLKSGYYPFTGSASMQ